MIGPQFGVAVWFVVFLGLWGKAVFDDRPSLRTFVVSVLWPLVLVTLVLRCFIAWFWRSYDSYPIG